MPKTDLTTLQCVSRPERRRRLRVCVADRVGVPLLLFRPWPSARGAPCFFRDVRRGAQHSLRDRCKEITCSVCSRLCEGYAPSNVPVAQPAVDRRPFRLSVANLASNRSSLPRPPKRTASQDPPISTCVTSSSFVKGCGQTVCRQCVIEDTVRYVDCPFRPGRRVLIDTCLSNVQYDVGVHQLPGGESIVDIATTSRTLRHYHVHTSIST